MRASGSWVSESRGAGLQGGFENTAVNTAGAMREIFRDWAVVLREGLDQLKTFPTLPGEPPPAG